MSPTKYDKAHGQASKYTRGDPSDHEEKTYGYGSRISYLNLKNIFYIGSILAIIIWGSSFLIMTITNLKSVTSINTSVIEEYLKKNSPPLNTQNDHKIFPNSIAFDSGDKIPLNFSATRSGKFTPNFKQLQWIKEPESISNDKGTFVLTERVNDQTRYLIKSIVDETYEKVLYNDSSFVYAHNLYNIDDLIASPDLTKAILKTNTTKNWRHSSIALYWVLDVPTNNIEPLHNVKDKVAVTNWSPTSSHIAFVYENNVYIKSLNNKLEITQVTFDGSENIFYGKPDWVYEEEVFGTDLALWWSPDGSKITFLKTNDTSVPDFTLSYYVQSGYEDYPEISKIKYPKAGYPNPIVDIIIYDLKGLEEFSSTQFKSNQIKDKLITEVVWVSNNNILVKTTNRASDLLEIFLINSDSNDAKLIRSHKAEGSWFEITSNTLFIPKNESLGRENDGYIDTVVLDGYNHLAYFSPPTNPNGIILTKGKWEVINGVSSFDNIKNNIFFTGTLKSSIERHIYSVNLLEAIANTKDLPNIKNITDTSTDGWYSGSFSSGSRYLLLYYDGPNVPNQKLVDLHNFKFLQTIESNNELNNNLQKYQIPKVRYSVIEIGTDAKTGEKIKANAVETLPLNFNPKYKYPVLFFVYGGPGSQLVTKEFSISFSSVVAAELNAIVVTVDGRGTGYNNHHEKLGSDYKFIVRDQLGHYEPIDQIAAAKIWRDKSYVDPDRIAIWGWSYGGFLTLKTLETDFIDHVFSFGVSIAPVTKWKLYDSIYTERYLREPKENPIGYETASINNLTNFNNVNRFLIMHGSGDDNVHFQNSLKLLDEFNLEGIENFDFMVFPDSDHSIRYHNGNIVVYDRILTWLRKAFNNEFY